MPRFDRTSYGPLIGELLSAERIPPLGPGKSNAALEKELRGAASGRLFAHTRIKDPAMADSCRSALWLYHDFLDESHTISQSIETPTGSYWHGIMHRREPDFSNAAYWFRRVGRHPIFPQLAQAVCVCVSQAQDAVKVRRLATCADWDPFAFIKLCEAVYETSGSDHDLCRRISLIEWQLLFDYSYRHAVGT